MKIKSIFVYSSLTLVLALAACTSKEPEMKTPATPPDQVVLKFYSLLAQGGKLTLKEAHGMLTSKFGPVDPDSFRKWVQDFDTETKIKIIETKIPNGKAKGGLYIATVKMEVATPSVFGDAFISTSQTNLILDEKTNEWKIDFLAETNKYEIDYKNAPLEANPESVSQ